jgi:hypothetical protein
MFTIDLDKALRESSVNIWKMYRDYSKTGVSNAVSDFILSLHELLQSLSDRLKSDLYDNLFISTATGGYLDTVVDQEVGIDREYGETDESFRERAHAYLSFLIEGMTIDSVKTFIELLGYTVDSIYKTYDNGSFVSEVGMYLGVGQGWINYIVIYYLPDITQDDINYLEGLLNSVRPIGITKPLIRKSN